MRIDQKPAHDGWDGHDRIERKRKSIDNGRISILRRGTSA
jgi:hypothetical protein